MTLTEQIYNILDAAGLSVPEIWAGTAAGFTDAADGLLTFFPLPAPGANFADGTSVTPYQFDIWAKDMYDAEQYKEEVVNALLGYAGIFDGKALIFTMDSDAGALPEDESQIWHYAVTFNVKYARR